MPVDRSRYPDNWEQISLHTRERAGNRCEWCGVENHAIGTRDKFGVWHDESMIETMNSDLGLLLFGEGYPKIIKIVLTVHHIGLPKYPGDAGDKHDKMDCRPNNLVALCQKCHLAADHADHIRHARETRKRKHEERTGQMRLF